jgi:hypothetical protein
VRGPDIDRELRAIYTPPVPAGDEIEVTALWDVRVRRGGYVITVTADAFSQIDEAGKDNNSASINVTVRDNQVEPTWAEGWRSRHARPSALARRALPQAWPAT